MPGAAQYPPSLSVQPSWLELVSEGGEGSAPVGDSPLPGTGWPRLESVDYLNKLIILVILLLALPWLLGKLVSDPGKASRHAAGFAMGSSSLAGS